MSLNQIIQKYSQAQRSEHGKGQKIDQITDDRMYNQNNKGERTEEKLPQNPDKEQPTDR